jgi:hypothetical protein
MAVITITLVRMTNARVLDSAHLVERVHFSRAQWSLHFIMRIQYIKRKYAYIGHVH